MCYIVRTSQRGQGLSLRIFITKKSFNSTSQKWERCIVKRWIVIGMMLGNTKYKEERKVKVRSLSLALFNEMDFDL